MNSFEETKYLLKKYNIKANKSLGQNFLIDDDIINRIVESAEISKDDIVIEIGPGLGTLTSKLLDKANKVICVEIDKRMIGILQERFIAYNNFEIINQDVLKVDLNKLITEKKKEINKENVKCKIVANLPYYITTPIIMKLLEENLDIESITVMIQKEVADRLIEIPGKKNTGAITYSIYYYCDSKKIVEVPNTSFIPSPEVTSEVIKLSIREKPPVEVENTKVMFMIIKSAFLQRRKTLINALTNSKVFENKMDAQEAFKKMQFDENIRAEELSIEDFASITNYILKNINKKI